MGPSSDLAQRLNYYAGLFDGEGTVYLSQEGRNLRGNRMAVVAAIAMTDTIALAYLLRDFGGSVGTCGRMPKPTHYKQPYRWTVKSQKAAVFLRAVRPYVLVKAVQIDVALEFQRRVDASTSQRHAGLSEAECTIRHDLRDRLRQLKRIPVHGVLDGIGANSGNGVSPNPELTRRQSLKRVETIYPGQSLN